MKISKYIHVPILTGGLVVIGFWSWMIATKMGYSFWLTFVSLFVVLALMGRLITRGDEW